MISRLGSRGPQLGVGLVLRRNRQTHVTLRKHQCDKRFDTYRYNMYYTRTGGLSVLLGAARLRLRGANIPPPRGRHERRAGAFTSTNLVGGTRHATSQKLALSGSVLPTHTSTKWPRRLSTLAGAERGTPPRACVFCTQLFVVYCTAPRNCLDAEGFSLSGPAHVLAGPADSCQKSKSKPTLARHPTTPYSHGDRRLSK